MRIIIITSLFLLFTMSCKIKKTNTEKSLKFEEVNNVELEEDSEGNHWINEMKEGFSDSLVVYLQRTACFGVCPIYVLSIYENGTVIYEGEKFVDKEGKFRAMITKEAIQKIQEKALSIDYFKMNEVYDNPNVTDLPSTITALQQDLDFKVVVNRYEAPQPLNSLESYIDELVENLNWEKLE